MGTFLLSLVVNLTVLLISVGLGNEIDYLNSFSSLPHESSLVPIWMLLTVLSNAACMLVVLTSKEELN